MTIKYSGKFDYLKKLAEFDLTPAEGWVLVMALNYADNNGANAYPGERQLASDTGLSVRQVRRHLTNLRIKGFLRAESRGAGSRSTRYVFTLPGETGHQRPIETGHQCPVGDDTNRTPATGKPDIRDHQTGHLGSPNRTLRVTKQDTDVRLPDQNRSDQTIDQIIEQLPGNPTCACPQCGEPSNGDGDPWHATCRLESAV